MARPEKQKDHMRLRGGNYYVRLDVPKDLRESFKVRVLERSLKTGDKRLALEIRHNQIAIWKSEFRALRDARQLLKDKRPDWQEPLSAIGKNIKEICNKLIGEYSRWKDDLIEVNVPNVGNMPFPLPPHEINNRLLEAVNSLSVDLSLKLDFCDWLIELDLPQYHNESDFFKDLEAHAIKLYVERSQEQYSLDAEEEEQAASILLEPESYKLKSPITNGMIENWLLYLKTPKPPNKETISLKTINSHLSQIKKISEYLTQTGKPLNFDSVEAFLSTLSPIRGTQKKYLSSGSNFWKWALKNNNHFKEEFSKSSNPFEKQDLPSKTSSDTDEYEAFTDLETECLFKEAMIKEDYELACLIALAAYTGARRGEIGRISQVNTFFNDNGDPSYFKITKAKSKAGIRDVPINSKLIALFKCMLKNANKNGGYLFACGNSKYENRMDVLGKRFSSLKTEMGFSELNVFHSIRKTMVTQLENAGITENLAADIIGHKKPRITYGLYSGGHNIELKIEAIEKLAFNFDLRGLIDKLEDSTK